MKRLTKRSLVAAVAIALTVTVIAAVILVLATTQGTRWFFKSVTHFGGGSFSAQKIEGRIVDHLLLTEVRVGLGQLNLEFDSIELRWKPLLLLTGRVAVRELVINGVRIQDDSPPDNKAPVLAWPKLPGSAQLFEGRIARLQMTNISYRRLQEQPLRVMSINSSVSWQDGLLSGSNLKALSPSGQLAGSFSLGFNRPSLTADIAVFLENPLAGIDQFSLQARQGHDSGPEPFVGTVKVVGSAGSRKRLELGGEVGMARNAINLRRLSLIRTGRKGLISGDGALTFTARESELSMQVKVAGFDLAPELNVSTDLSGSLRFAGTLDSYRGDFSLANQAQGWQAAEVAANFQGTGEGLKLAPLTGRVIDGTLAGKLALNWRDGFALQGVISGRNLNPARIAPEWQGVANFDAVCKLVKEGESPLTGSVSGVLLESRLHGQALTGQLQADYTANNLSLNSLTLQGNGFDLHASGELNRRLVLSAQISDFSRLVPGSAGTLKADGWVLRRDGQLSGALSATGSKLDYAGTRIAAVNLNARLDQGTAAPLHLAASLHNVVYDGYRLNAVKVAADGTLPRHTLNATLRSAGAEARLNLNAGYKDGTWKGNITNFAGRDNNGSWSLAAPAAFVVSADKFFLSTLALTAAGAEHLEVAVDLALTPMSGQVRAQWAGLDLARANPYLKDTQITGSSSGSVRCDFLSGKLLTLAGSAAGSGTFTGHGHSLTLQQSLVTFDGSEQGLRGDIKLVTADGGRLKGTFTSSVPLRLAKPENLELAAELSGIDLALLKLWLPSETGLAGRISGRLKGIMLPEQRFELDGNAVLSEGKFHQSRPDGELKLSFTSAKASWGWRGDTLSGTLSLTLAEQGQAQAELQLPLAARFPLAVNPKGPLRASVTGQFREMGLISALFPDLVRESHGELDADLAVSGTWKLPQVGGKLRLTKAGAYLPTAGIHLKDVQLEARLEKNLIRINSFRALSGPGHIEGTALITLGGWQVIGYQGTIRGENFQTIFFPELQVLTTPKLSFAGTPQKLTLRGELRLPELHFVGAPSRKAIAPSSDVVREGRVVPVARSSPLVLDAQIRLLLGEKVFVKVAGIDARLGGAIDLAFSRLDRITSKGEIKVVKGRYRTYGVNLEIVRGRLFFAGGTIDRPSLDFLALRTIGNVRAGVTVAGTLQKPVTRLYSEPAMPDVDVLAYIVLGHPLGSSGEQASLVARAAGAVLTSSQATVLQEQIKSHLGLSTLEIQGGVGGTTSHMGYKPLPVTPPGAIPATQQSGITETVLTVGKYLTPQIYISYGKSLFTGSNLVRLRYDISKKWQIETQTGDESGADLFYRLEFDK